MVLNIEWNVYVMLIDLSKFVWSNICVFVCVLNKLIGKMLDLQFRVLFLCYRGVRSYAIGANDHT